MLFRVAKPSPLKHADHWQTQKGRGAIQLLPEENKRSQNTPIMQQPQNRALHEGGTGAVRRENTSGAAAAVCSSRAENEQKNKPVDGAPILSQSMGVFYYRKAGTQKHKAPVLYTVYTSRHRAAVVTAGSETAYVACDTREKPKHSLQDTAAQKTAIMCFMGKPYPYSYIGKSVSKEMAKKWKRTCQRRFRPKAGM